MKVTAVANANIALVKYWGKRDSKLILPHNSNISMTCDGLQTKTTVEFSPEYAEDSATINGEDVGKDEKITNHLELIRKMANTTEKAKVVSETNFPVAAGLASSASGFAALSMAAATAAGLNLSEKELTILSRRGSGSASRSISEGFVEWHRGEKDDGSDSYGNTIAQKSHWPEFRMITTIVTEKKKPVSSRAGMSQTVKTCPYYEGWLKTVNEDLQKMRQGIAQKDFTIVGETAEYNCIKMHATMMTTQPPVIYWIAATMEIIHEVRRMREEGIPCYFTIDAGPNVKVICLQENENKINERLLALDGVQKTILCKPGDGAKLTEEHLF